MSVSLDILQSYYPAIRGLRHHLSEILEPSGESHNFLVQNDDTLQYKWLLNESYVACIPSRVQTKRFQTISPMIFVREIIERAQEKLFLKAKGRPSNVITAGYRPAKYNCDFVRPGNSRTPLMNHFVNTIVNALQAPEWETLFQRIGEDAMFHLLTETSLFVSLPNQCFCQLIGEPIVHMKPPNLLTGLHRTGKSESTTQAEDVLRHGVKRKMSEPGISERPAKRLKLLHINMSASSTNSTTVCAPEVSSPSRTPADITFPRSRMFYSWPYFIPHTNRIAIGLPPKHVFNRFHPSHTRQRKVRSGKWVDPDPIMQADDARHLSKYIFPRQYRLSNPFSVPQKPLFQAYTPPDYLVREDEIQKRGICKTPKRLKPVLELLDKMIWRHGKCGYKALLEFACPSKIITDKEPLDSSIILEMMSEHSIELRSQLTMADINVSVDSAGRSIVPLGLSQAQKHFKHKPRFAEFACTFAEVYRYAVLVTNAVIPKAFWGCEKNKKLVLGHVKTFISARRYETTTLHNVLQGFSLMECEWLYPAGSKTQPRVCATDVLKRRELLEEFLFWYYDSFLLPLLKTTFYVTESSAFRRRILYFRQDDWSTLCGPLIEKLSADTFQKIEQCEAEEILRQRKLGFSFVRLLPKETGVRPIVNLRRRKPTGKGALGWPEQSINQILQAAFQILTYEKENHPQLLGASVFGSNEVYTKLKAFKSRLMESRPDKTMPKLYFVKVDVQACFDTIEQTKLLEIIREVLSEDAYMIQRYGQVNSVGSKIRRKYVRKAHSEDDHPHFLTYASKLAEALRHTIFVDQVVYSFSKKQEIIELLEEHITENIVKIGGDYYRQVVGIPQGSVLSALLCSFFYGDLEQRHFKFTDDPQSVLLRLIDDYLLITTDLEKARRFLGMMIHGHPEYGCFISKEKTLTNFDYDPNMNVIEPRQRNFPWCGYMIDMSDLSVSADYTRYHDGYLQDSLTVEKGRRPGQTFVHKMMQLTKAKSHIIFCDSDLNGPRTLYLNIYQNFLLSAMKMHHYLRQWGLDVGKSASFIRSTVYQMIRYTYATMRNKASNKVARASGGRCKVQQAQVTWLGTHAFYTALSRKSHTYPQLIKWLELELARPRNRRLRKQFRGIVKEGLSTLTLLAF